MTPPARPISHARVLGIAIPIVISNATVPILGIVDTAVVGQLGAAAPIGAVGLGAVILSAIYWIFGFLRMGTTGLTAQAVGRADGPETAALLTRALMIGAAAGIVIIALQAAWIAGALAVAPATPQVEALTREYLSIRVWSAPAAIALYGINGWLIAQERTRAVLGLQIVLNGLNILLDLWFVLGLDWGVGGVAGATVIAEWAGLALGLWLCRGAFRLGAWRDWARVFDPVRLRHMMAVNGDILIRSVMLQAIFLSFMFFGSGLGEVPLAANQVLLQFLYVTGHGLDGFAFAAEALVGNALGRGDRARLRRAVRVSCLWGAISAGVLAVVYAVAGGAIIDMMTTAAPVRAEARNYLIYLVISPVLGVAAFMLDGIFIGATRTREMRNMMALSLAIYAASVAVLLPLLGNHGLWLAMLISFIARGVTLYRRYPAVEAELA